MVNFILPSIFLENIPYLTEVSFLVLGLLRDYAIYSYLPLLSLAGRSALEWCLFIIIGQLSMYFLVGHGVYTVLYNKTSL